MGFYFISEKIYSSLNVYITFDTFSVLFTDTVQILFNAWHDHAGEIVILICGSLLLGVGHVCMSHFLIKNYSTIKGKKSLKRYCLVFLIVIILFGGLITMLCLRDPVFASACKCNSFPTSYASVALIQSWCNSLSFRKDVCVNEFLEPIISLEEYAKQNAPLKNI